MQKLIPFGYHEIVSSKSLNLTDKNILWLWQYDELIFEFVMTTIYSDLDSLGATLFWGPDEIQYEGEWSSGDFSKFL